MQDKDTFAIDLLWLRVGKNGGSESYIRNILDGMQETDRDFKAVLLVSKDNGYSFEHYADDSRFVIHHCDVYSANVTKRMIWQNLHLRNTIRKLGIKKCYEPIYSIPFIRTGGVDFYTVIHDLQAKHFPEYFSKARCIWMDISWSNAVKKSKRIITISDYSREDISETYNISKDMVTMIHNPVSVSSLSEAEAIELIEGFGLGDKKFFFTVSSLLPHKNLETLLRAIEQRKDSYKLVIAGVGGHLKGELENQINKKNLSDKVVILPFIKNEERDALYKCCNAFLFPSIFEGFGMPPIEAMLYDKHVITTKKTSLYEVTMGEAVYVDDPFDEKEWNEQIDQVISGNPTVDFENRKISSVNNPYTKKTVASNYLDVLLGNARD